ncbi:hypothetical protein Patl1_23893 [Pistacia atlantica]|uniref:Uncharacterized protein n=1 Tax=Pistacia atlantica TaxID=434234 RepID=A0ACC1A1V9_9ROSI|nr:hypothetical protein Patl1_23893 [Pistacia atlantica]
MIKFHGDSNTADVYIIMEEIVEPDVSNMPASRSSRRTLSEAVPPVNAPLDVVEDIVDDTNNPDIPLGASLEVVVDSHHIDVNVDDTQIELPAEISPILPHVNSNEKHAKAAHQWRNTITGIGQRFSSAHEFCALLRKYAIAHQFAFRYKKNERHRVFVKCKAEGCPWRIHASKLSTSQLICIKKMNPTHTCEGTAVTKGHQATRSFVASIIKEKLKIFPNYKPKDIVNYMKEEYGIQLNYFQAWRGREIAKEQLHGSYKEAFNQLPFFCEKIMETYPGSFATFNTKGDSSFHRLFVSFHASLYGFQQGCRPLLFLGKIPLKSRYDCKLLTATAADGNDGVFPVAFALVCFETVDNWHWFLLQLKTALSAIPCPITFVANKEMGLRESIAEIFTDSYHAYCPYHLSKGLIKSVRWECSSEEWRLLAKDLYAAAYVLRPEGFQKSIESIKGISVKAYNWIIQIEPQNWANAFFQCTRCNHMTSHFGEPFYSWLTDADELPITQVVDVIREKLEKENLKARNLQVILLAGSTWEVRGDTIEVVDMDHWGCSCKGWQLNGLPCCHAIAVITCMGRSAYDYCSRYFTTEMCRLTYSETIHPVPNLDRPVQADPSQVAVTVTPPTCYAGRPTAGGDWLLDEVNREFMSSRLLITTSPGIKGSGT